MPDDLANRNLDNPVPVDQGNSIPQPEELPALTGSVTVVIESSVTYLFGMEEGLTDEDAIREWAEVKVLDNWMNDWPCYHLEAEVELDEPGPGSASEGS